MEQENICIFWEIVAKISLIINGLTLILKRLTIQIDFLFILILMIVFVFRVQD